MTTLEQREAKYNVFKTYGVAPTDGEGLKEYTEILCRSMIDAILAHCSQKKWNADTIVAENEHYLDEFINGDTGCNRRASLGLDRVKELINEQINDIDHIELSPETSEGLTYPCIVWKREMV